MKRTAAVAGTFNVIHDGHAELFRRSFEVADKVLVGITDDMMASEGREESVPFHVRRGEVERFLSRYGKEWEIMCISDIYGPREFMDGVDILVLSEETFDNGILLNQERKGRGIRPMEISVVPIAKAFDGSKISSSSILKGKYAKNGRYDVKDIVVGSLNRVKIEAVRSVMERIYGDVRITAADVDSGVPPQPFGDETREGAVNRARKALGGHEMSVGIEAGVFEMKDGLFDFQYCAILDDGDHITIGVGPGFKYPEDISELVRNGHTVGDAVKMIHGNADIGKGQGAVGLLSGGLLDRKTLTEQSVTAAMIPRMSKLTGISR